MPKQHSTKPSPEKDIQTAPQPPMTGREIRATADMILQHGKAEMPAAVADETREALDVARGIDELLMNGTTSGHGLNTHGCWALHATGQALIDCLTKIDTGLDAMTKPEK